MPSRLARMSHDINAKFVLVGGQRVSPAEMVCQHLIVEVHKRG